ncbi:filament-like plant protein 7 isoform X2 [Cornus florida]|uniref:filament-like plant protein 7 isoform X2 n=1 Tax=Cornus florida TaxID=4283 RepID=UPI002896ABAB|nr:filament-like plant protein 7 isoform X2 [Cornus florida]
MMDHKTWLWKKKPTEKALVTADKVNMKVNKEERDLTEKAELERELKISNDKLSLALSDCKAKDDLVRKHAQMAQEALAGWERAEGEAISLKQEFDEVLHQRVAGEARLTHMDAALSECMQQLRFVREEQEQRIHDAVMKTSKEFEKRSLVLEQKLAETTNQLAKLGAQNSQLSNALTAKEKMIDNLNVQRTQAEADFNALMTRSESTEKENASLKYEVRVLEKELEIRNEEREFNRRTADVAHKQHLESVKKIAKLESECQRLRVLVRKRLPGPAALLKMKNEVELLSRDPAETRRRKSPSPTASMDFSDNDPDTLSKRINFLTGQIFAMEEENRNLKETLNKKTNELQLSGIMYARATSRLSQVEAQLEETSKGPTITEAARSLPTQQEISFASMSDMGSDDKVSCAESWASALISELEHFRNGKQTGTPSRKTAGVSDINLMDDFVEMEKLATVSVDKPVGSSHLTSDEGSEIVGTLETQSGGGCSTKPPDNSLSMNSFDKVISEDISPEKKTNLTNSICKIIELIEGISLPSPDYGSLETLSGKDGNFFPCKNLEAPTGYTVRVFQWKTSELGTVLQQFVQTCKDLSTGKTQVENFAENLTSALDWIMNHCFSIQDVSSMKDEIKKHFDWDETRSESEIEGGMISQFSDADKLRFPKEELSYLPIVSASHHNCLFQLEELQPDVMEDSKRLKDQLANMESAKEDLEGRLQSEIDKSEALAMQLRELEKTIESLRTELETLEKSKVTIEDQIECHKLVNKDLDTQLAVARAELDEASQKFLSLETELLNENKCSEELKATCLDLQLQLESVTKKEISKNDMDREEKQLRTDWEITAASEKLAECQENILKLGKQLKALASPNDAAFLDKVISSPTETTTTAATPKKGISRRNSLLDKMLAEDNAESGYLKSPMTKEVICISDPVKSPSLQDGNSFSTFLPSATTDPPETIPNSNGIKGHGNEDLFGSLAIVSRKKKGGRGFLKKLLCRKEER